MACGRSAGATALVATEGLTKATQEGASPEVTNLGSLLRDYWDLLSGITGNPPEGCTVVSADELSLFIGIQAFLLESLVLQGGLEFKSRGHGPTRESLPRSLEPEFCPWQLRGVQKPHVLLETAQHRFRFLCLK